MPAHELSDYLLAASAAFLFGVPIGAGFPDGRLMAAGVMILAAAVIGARRFRNDRRKVFCLAIAIGICCGFLCAARAQRSANHYASDIGTHAAFTGAIVSEPKPAAHGLSFEFVADGHHGQKVLATAAASADPELGQRIQLAGTLHLPQSFADDTTGGVFNYPGYLKSEGVYATVSSPQIVTLGWSAPRPQLLLLRAASALKDALYRRLVAQYSADRLPLLLAVLFGDRASLPDVQLFIAVGAVHIIAVSGFKLTLVAIACSALLRPLLGRWSAAAIMPLMLLYAAAFGFSPALLRSFAMSAAFLLGDAAGGGYDAKRVLIFAAALFAVCNPLAEAYDSSFLFSLLGVLGIIVLVPLVRRIPLWPRSHAKAQAPWFCRAILFPSAAAYLATLPLMVYSYGQLPLLGVIVSSLLTPLMELAIALGYASILFPSALGIIAAALNSQILRAMDAIVNAAATIPHADPAVSIPAAAAYACYALVGLYYIWYTVSIVSLQIQESS